MRIRQLSFKEFGLLMIVFNGMNAISGIVQNSYTFAGCSIAIGVIWIWIIDKRGDI
jgi:hypothetical protein